MKPVPSTDMELLGKIFFPGQRGFGLLSGGHQPTAAHDFWFAFGKKRELPGFQRRSFGYVNNPDGSIRWLYPVGSRRPHFLRLYNGSGWRGRFFQLAFKMAFGLGLERLARSGTLHVFYKNQSPLGGPLSLCPWGNMAVFTGTVGENRKAVVAFDDGAGERWFFKQPLTGAAAQLVQNERQVLAFLAELPLQKMVVPSAKPQGTGLLVSDVKPRAAANSFDLQPAHFEAVAELVGLSLELSPLASLPFWSEANHCLEALQTQPILNDLPPSTVGRLIDRLLALRDELASEPLVPTALAHGDFTPWNMYLGPDRLHVYDWELAERLPLLHDVFHFIFQSGVMVKKQPFAEIRAAIFALKNKEKVQEMLVGEGRDFERLFRFYLLRNISYYLLKYLRQQPLHEQAHWQLAAWDEALESQSAALIGQH